MARVDGKAPALSSGVTYPQVLRDDPDAGPTGEGYEQRRARLEVKYPRMRPDHERKGRLAVPL